MHAAQARHIMHIQCESLALHELTHQSLTLLVCYTLFATQDCLNLTLRLGCGYHGEPFWLHILSL